MPTPELDDHRRRNLECVLAAFAAIGVGDAEGQLRHYTEDLEIEFPFTDPPRSVKGKETALPYLRGAFEVFRFTLTVTAVHPCLDPDELILEMDGEGTHLPSGSPYRNSYVVIFRFRDGLIAHQREYFNPLAAARLADR